jgi:hypothetical protein
VHAALRIRRSFGLTATPLATSRLLLFDGPIRLHAAAWMNLGLVGRLFEFMIFFQHKGYNNNDESG